MYHSLAVIEHNRDTLVIRPSDDCRIAVILMYISHQHIPVPHIDRYPELREYQVASLVLRVLEDRHYAEAFRQIPGVLMHSRLPVPVDRNRGKGATLDNKIPVSILYPLHLRRVPIG